MMEHDILIKLLIASRDASEKFPGKLLAKIFMNKQPNRILHFTVI
jgi:hypothetical protein